MHWGLTFVPASAHQGLDTPSLSGLTQCRWHLPQPAATGHWRRYTTRPWCKLSRLRRQAEKVATSVYLYIQYIYIYKTLRSPARTGAAPQQDRSILIPRLSYHLFPTFRTKPDSSSFLEIWLEKFLQLSSAGKM